MRKRGRKELSMVGVIIIIILLFSLGFIIISFIGILKEPITFAIQLNQKDIPKNTDGVLLFTVKNYWTNQISNVTVGTELDYPYDKQFSSRELRNLGFFDSDTGAYVFKTTYLPVGNYTVKSVLVYSDSSNRVQRKELTLGFRII